MPEPGITSTVTSAPSVTSSGPSAGTPLLVGHGDLSGSNAANANEVYAVAESAEAQSLFGTDSKLTQNVIDALNMGAEPVLAVAPSTSTTTQDLSGMSSADGQLSSPAVEDPDTMTVSVDSSSKTVKVVYKDLSNYTVSSGNVAYNPTNDNFKLDATPSSDGSFEYEALDYTSALDAVETYTGDPDFLAALKERSSITTNVLGVGNTLANEYTYALVVAGLPLPVDANNWTNSYDTSRLQLVAPTRLEDGTPFIGAYLGLRGNIGLTETPINQQIPLQGRPMFGYDSATRDTLISKKVTPFERIGESVRVADDITTVSDDNSDEQNYRFGFSRLAVDFLLETVHRLEQPFIGKFNSPGVIDQLEDLLNKEARPLQESNAIYSYDASITLIDPTTAKVTFTADVAEPIRFIENEFVIGQNLA